MEIFSKLYEQNLEKAICRHKESLPGNIVLIITESDLLEESSPRRLIDFIKWCREYGIRVLTIYVSMIELDEKETDRIYRELTGKVRNVLKNVDCEINLFSIEGEVINISSGTDDNMQINISVGYGGKKELTTAFKEIMSGVASGTLRPEDIDGSIIEKYLLIKIEPDLVIRSGGERLADFLIWQSVYSEIYFTDVSWINLRKLDFLRAIRDFQKRQRRFGK